MRAGWGGWVVSRGQGAGARGQARERVGARKPGARRERWLQAGEVERGRAVEAKGAKREEGET